MDAEKYNRSVNLLCPTCGSTQFSHSGVGADTSEILTCSSCGLEISREDLIRANGENIHLHFKEMGQDVIKDLKGEFAKHFRGNKFFKLK